jgi:phosphatidylinositol-3-phosphatase
LLALVCALPAARAAPQVPEFDHVIVIVFENKESGSVLGTRAAPTFNRYARAYGTLTRYYAITHPSLPNYLALVSGSTHGVTTDCTDCTVDAPNLAVALEEGGRTWKTYAEGLPGSGFTGGRSGRYAKKHNPFLYFSAVADDSKRRAQVVPFTQLAGDLRAKRLPDFALIVPDLCNSMHDCGVATGDAWLRRVTPPLLKLPRTVVFILFDEGQTRERGGGHVPALALGTAVRPHSRFTGLAGHYRVLRTIEEAWALPLLGESVKMRPIVGIWR